MSAGTTPGRSLDLKALESFAAVVEGGSMGEAARALGVTQSAVSQQIGGLERALGVKLFDRRMRPLRLTPAGLMLRDYAARIVSLSQQARNAVMAAGDSPIAELRLGVVHSLASTLAPDLVLTIKRQLRPARVSVWSGLSFDQGQALVRRELDLIITADPLSELAGLERHALIREPFVLLVPAALKLARPDLESLAARLPLLRYTARQSTGRQVERQLSRLGVNIAQQADFDITGTLAEIVARGGGWAITTPICLMDGHLDDPRLRVLPFPAAGFSRRLTLIARAGELGAVPQALARQGREIFAAHCLPRLLEVMPWCDRLFDPGGRDV